MPASSTAWTSPPSSFTSTTVVSSNWVSPVSARPGSRTTVGAASPAASACDRTSDAASVAASATREAVGRVRRQQVGAERPVEPELPARERAPTVGQARLPPRSSTAGCQPVARRSSSRRCEDRRRRGPSSSAASRIVPPRWTCRPRSSTHGSARAARTAPAAVCDVGDAELPAPRPGQRQPEAEVDGPPLLGGEPGDRRGFADRVGVDEQDAADGSPCGSTPPTWPGRCR